MALFGEIHKSFVADDINLIRPLLEQKIISLFADSRRYTKRFSPITIMGRSIELSHGVLQKYIDIKETLLLSIRQLNFQSDYTDLRLLLDFSIDKTITPSIAELISEGVDVIGCIIENETQVQDKRLTNQRHVIGVAHSIKEDNIFVSEKMAFAPDQISIEAGFLEASFYNIKKILNHISPKQFPRLLNELDRCVIQRSEGEYKFNKIKETSEWFQKLGEIKLQPSLSVSVKKLVTNKQTFFPAVRTVPSATYIFDAASLKSENLAPKGLSKYGPYSRNIFTPTSPEVCVICDKDKRGETEVFLKKFKDGISTGQRFEPYGRGFLQIYGLYDIKFTFFEASSFSASAYYEAASTAIRSRADSVNSWALAIVQSERESRNLPAKENPYLIAKAAFLSNQIVTQAVATETFELPLVDLAYTLSNFALATYAKLGGIRWLIKSDSGISHEVVLGIGSASIGESRFSKKERIVGITSVFRGDGGYLLSNLSQAVPFDEYRGALISSLKETL